MATRWAKMTAWTILKAAIHMYLHINSGHLAATFFLVYKHGSEGDSTFQPRTPFFMHRPG